MLMYLTERLIGVLVYATALIIVCLLINYSKTEKLGRILFIYNIVLSIMAFLFVPNPGADLFRLVPIMHGYSQATFHEIWNTAFESGSPVAILYMYAIGKMNIDGLLPGVTSFIFFNNVFYILRRAALRYNVRPSDSSLVLLFFMSTGIFFEVISGIRTMLAFSIIAKCLYKEMADNTLIFKNLFWYGIAALLHPIALGLTLIRFCFLLMQLERNVIRRSLNGLLVIIFGMVFLTYPSQYIQYMLDKAESYLTLGTYSYFWQYIIGGLDLLVMILIQIIVFIMVKQRTTNISEKNILRFSSVVTIIIGFLITEYNSFHRLTMFNSIITIPLFLYLITNLDYNKRAEFKTFFLLVSLVLLFIASSRGNLSSLKFFVL